MDPLTLVIGDRNYSSWSLRPWILLKHLGLAFEEVLVPLDTPSFAHDVRRYSPSGRVPALLHGSLVVYESLAIVEYASELAGGRGWPADRALRAAARASATEMHGGFATLRGAYPMNIRARGRRVTPSPALMADVARIDTVWTECRARHATRGPWLYGDYSIADAMYLPVAFRFQTYGTDGLGVASRAYLGHALADPLLEPWVRAAEAETSRLAAEEVGRP